MYPQSSQIGDLLSGNQFRAVVASRDKYGIPHLSPVFVWHWDEDSVWFAKFPASRTAGNLSGFPEMSVSIVDWAKFQGLQVKGLASRQTKTPANPQASSVFERLQKGGATEIFRVEVMEVFDVIPRQGADLSVPLWQRKRGWVASRDTLDFQKPAVKPVPVPEALRNKIAPVAEKMRGQFMPTFIGTVGDEGDPNISPRFILEVGSDYWFYGDGFRNKTFVNASRPSPLCVAMIDWSRDSGYLAHGWTEMRYTGDWLEKIKSHWETMRFKNVAIQAVLFHPEDIEEVALGQPSPLFRERPVTAWALSGARQTL
jgi:hypothetical protein